MPVRVEHCRLRTNSGGPGNKRGGLGMQRALRMLDKEATYSVLSDRAVIPPYGILGGGSGAPVSVSIESSDGVKSVDVPGKATGYIIRKGDLIVMESAGGGGYGDPLSRSSEAVLKDLAAGYISADQARSAYGVCVDENGLVDEVETGHLRSNLRSSDLSLEVFEGDADPYEGIKGRHRTVSISRKFAQESGLADGHLVELVGKYPSPLRGWVKLKDGEASKSFAIKLDRFARRCLGVGAGDRIRIRALPTLVQPGEKYVAGLGP